jgi:hypothetical protein
MPSWQVMYNMRAVSVVTQTSCLYWVYSIPEAGLPVNRVCLFSTYTLVLQYFNNDRT